MNNISRHPKINYWFWDEKTITDKQYLKNIDIIAENSDFNLLMLTERSKLNFWKPEFKPIFKETVEYAHSKGIKIALQLWQRGFRNCVEVPEEEAAALVTEYEETYAGGGLVIDACGKNARYKEFAPPMKSEFLFAGAFKKTGEGFYDEKSFLDITSMAQVTKKENPEELQISFEDSKLEGYTIYVMVAHYYHYGDLFSDFYINEYKHILDFYKDIPFDGFGLDEFRNIIITPPWEIGIFRERIYGKAFSEYYKEKTGEDLVKTMFEMRFCPDNHEEIRINAINRYFDIFRHSTLRIENFVAEYAYKTWSEDIFMGVHNTYHNTLQSDEIWQTCCNWWELPRKYAQTDENICPPVRMGIACCYPEKIVYDMYYHKDKNTFFEKAVSDARFNTRIHYHAINDGRWGVDTGSEEFLKEISPIESKITLLDIFEPTLPKMELLVVFGFPALCNWYPDYAARNSMDVNGKLDIIKRVNRIWNDGYLNALAPSDAISDGRITMKDGKYDYCGHKFDKLLYLYPEYSKPEVVKFMETAVADGYEIKILGEYTHGFDGKNGKLNIDKDYFINEESDIALEMNLKANTILNGCVSEDGSVVISDYDSVMNDSFCCYNFELDGHKYEAEFRGTLAFKPDENGDIGKLVAGNMKSFKKDGETLISLSGGDDYIKL